LEQQRKNVLEVRASGNTNADVAGVQTGWGSGVGERGPSKLTASRAETKQIQFHTKRVIVECAQIFQHQPASVA